MSLCTELVCLVHGLCFSKYTPKLLTHIEIRVERLKQSGIFHGQCMKKVQLEYTLILNFLNSFENDLLWNKGHI